MVDSWPVVGEVRSTNGLKSVQLLHKSPPNVTAAS